MTERLLEAIPTWNPLSDTNCGVLKLAPPSSDTTSWMIDGVRVRFRLEANPVWVAAVFHATYTPRPAPKLVLTWPDSGSVNVGSRLFTPTTGLKIGSWLAYRYSTRWALAFVIPPTASTANLSSTSTPVVFAAFR